MAAIAVDTFKLAKRLQAAGFPAEQASAVAEAISETITEGLATKGDIETLRIEVIEGDRTIRNDLRELELKLDKRIDEVRLGLDRRIEEVRLGLDKRIEEVRLGLDKRIEEVRLALEARISEAKFDMMKWMFGAVGPQTITILGGVAALFRLMGS